MRKSIHKYFFLFFVLLFPLKTYTQVNFVQNPSFEELDTCSVPGFRIPPAYWDTLRAGGGGGPQICSLCGPDVLTVPITGFTSYQNAKTGNNYTYFGVWTSATISPGYTHERSYIQNELRSTLILGHTYCVTFYTSLMNESKYSISEIGAYLDDGSIATIPWGVSTQSPQVKSPVGVLLTDTLGWMKVQGSFVANGTERFLTLGNFKTTAATTRSVMPTAPTFTYQRNLADYYFDDISVIDIDLPAYAGGHKGCFAGDSVYLGRPREVGLDDACTWYKWPNLSFAFDSAKAGIWVKPVGTETYVLRQEICGNVKWDTAYVYPDAVGIKKFKNLNEPFDGTQGKELKISPNPSQSQIKISGNAEKQEIFDFEVMDTSGRVVFSKQIVLVNGSAAIDLDLAEGIYFIKVRMDDGSCFNFKQVVSR